MSFKVKKTVDFKNNNDFIKLFKIHPKKVVQQFVKTTKTHYRTINLDVESVPERQHYPAPVILPIKRKQNISWSI